MVKRIFVTILLLPVAEVLVYVLVVAVVGVWFALGLTVLSSLAGVAVLRSARLRATARPGPASGLAGRLGEFSAVAAGLLLLIPGFITSVAGAALLFPTVRRRLWSRLGRWPQPARTGRPEVIDLGPQEWQRMPAQADRARGSAVDP